jgi:hypothetical protein
MPVLLSIVKYQTEEAVSMHGTCSEYSQLPCALSQIIDNTILKIEFQTISKWWEHVKRMKENHTQERVCSEVWSLR